MEQSRCRLAVFFVRAVIAQWISLASWFVSRAVSAKLPSFLHARWYGTATLGSRKRALSTRQHVRRLLHMNNQKQTEAKKRPKGE